MIDFQVLEFICQNIHTQGVRLPMSLPTDDLDPQVLSFPKMILEQWILLPMGSQGTRSVEQLTINNKQVPMWMTRAVYCTIYNYSHTESVDGHIVTALYKGFLKVWYVSGDDLFQSQTLKPSS